MASTEVDLEARVVEVVSELTGADGALDLDTRLEDLGIDSLGYAELAGLVEQRLGVRVADEPVHGLSTVGSLVALVGAAPRSATDAGDDPEEPALPRGLGRFQVAADVTASRLIRRWFDLSVRGAELMPGSGPVIFCMNHESLLDIPVAVAASPRPVTFMAKRELFRNRVGGRFLHGLGGFSVDRDSFDLRAIRTALAVLAEGEVLGMYPEGTRRPGELLPFLHGAAWLALRTGAPLLPAALKGTEAAMPPGRKVPKRVPVEVIFDPPIAVARVDDPRRRRADAEELTARLRGVFERLLA